MAFHSSLSNSIAISIAKNIPNSNLSQTSMPIDFKCKPNQQRVLNKQFRHKIQNSTHHISYHNSDPQINYKILMQVTNLEIRHIKHNVINFPYRETTQIAKRVSNLLKVNRMYKLNLRTVQT